MRLLVSLVKPLLPIATVVTLSMPAVTLVDGQEKTGSSVSQESARSQSPTTLEDVALQARQLAYQQEVLLTTMREHSSRNAWLFGTITVIVGLLTYVQTRRENKLITAQERQINDARLLGTAYHSNISAVTQLVSTLEKALNIHTEAEKRLHAIDALKETVTSVDTYWKGQLDTLNDDAVQLSPKLTRKAINSRSTLQAVDALVTRYEFVSASPNVKGTNANCLFVVAFGHRARGQDLEAERAFQKAIDVAQEHVKSQPEASYRAIPSGTSREAWLTKLTNICHYHLGLTLANQGRYADAIRSFEQACQADPHDYKAAAYVPELTFFGGLAAFERIIGDYQTLLRKLAAAPPSLRLAQTPAELIAEVHVKMGNCYFARTDHRDYQSHYSAAKAESHYRLALAADGTSVVAKFSLAQALQMQNKERQRMEGLYADAYAQLRNEVSRLIEHKSLILHYYMIAVCCDAGRIGGDNGQIYSLKVYELLSELPNKESVRLFSPISKTDLTFDGFTADVRAFEKKLSQAASPQLDRRTSFAGR